MNIIETRLPGVLIIEPKVFGDERGFFLETHQARRYAEAGINGPFVQDNLSHSKKGAVRGLHYQLKYPQGKLVYVITGAVLDVVADVRYGSPTFGQWISVELNDQNHRQLYVPPGFAHGFCVLSETADFFYKCTDYYQPGDEYGVIWNDPTIGIDWPTIEGPLLSKKDLELPKLNEISLENLPVL